MKKTLCTIAAIIIVAMFIPSDSSARNLTIVYVTNTGDCYHTRYCSYLKSVNEITLVDAIMQDYRACSRCNPPSLSDDDWAELSEVLAIKNKTVNKSQYKETVSKAKTEYENERKNTENKIKELEQKVKNKDDLLVFSFIGGCIVSFFVTSYIKDRW